MTSRYRVNIAIAATVLALTASVGVASPAAAADSFSKCISTLGSGNSVKITNFCDTTYNVRAVFRWGKDPVRLVAGHKSYQFTSGSLAEYVRTERY